MNETSHSPSRGASVVGPQKEHANAQPVAAELIKHRALSRWENEGGCCNQLDGAVERPSADKLGSEDEKDEDLNSGL